VKSNKRRVTGISAEFEVIPRDNVTHGDYLAPDWYFMSPTYIYTEYIQRKHAMGWP